MEELGYILNATFESVLASIALGVVSGLLVKLAYSAVRTQWPDSYVYDRSWLEKTQRSSLAGYAAFRTVPLGLCIYLGAATVVNQGLEKWWFAGAAWLTFSMLTTIRAVVKSFRDRNLRRRKDLVLGFLRLVSSGVLVTMTTLLAEWAPQFAPAPRELVDAIWTAFFVALVAVGARGIIRTRTWQTEEKVAAAKRDMGDEIWNEIEETSRAVGADPDLVRAITVVEVLQRPRWMRRLERVLGRFQGRGTYGIAQVSSNQPVSDAESVAMLAEQLSRVRGSIAGSPWDRFEGYVPFVQGRGATPGYVDEVLYLYAHLSDERERINGEHVEDAVAWEVPSEGVVPIPETIPRWRMFGARLLMRASARLLGM